MHDPSSSRLTLPLFSVTTLQLVMSMTFLLSLSRYIAYIYVTIRNY